MLDPNQHIMAFPQGTAVKDSVSGLWYANPNQSPQAGPTTLRNRSAVWTSSTPSVGTASSTVTIGSGSLTYSKLVAYLSISTGALVQVVAAKLQVSPDGSAWYDLITDNSGTLALIIGTTVGGSGISVARDFALSFAPFAARLVATTITGLTGTVSASLEYGG